jgi:hypothetical protein
MAVVKRTGLSSPADILERVLDSGIVIDAAVRLNLTELELSATKSQIVVHSLEVASGGTVAISRKNPCGDHAPGELPAETRQA